MNWRGSRAELPGWSEALREAGTYGLSLFDALVASGWSASRPQLLQEELQGWQSQTALWYSMRNAQHSLCGNSQWSWAKHLFSSAALQQWSRDPGREHHPWRFCSCSTPDLALAVAVLWQESWIRNLLCSWVLILHWLKPAVRPC